MPRQLTSQHETRVERILAAGSFADADQVLSEALGLLEERERRLRLLRGKLQVGLDSGEPIAYTPELMDEIEHETEERFRRGESPSPGVWS